MLDHKKLLNPHGEATMRDAMNAYMTRVLRERTERLEREAQDLIDQGYSIDQLTIIIQDDNDGHVRPKSELDEVE